MCGATRGDCRFALRPLPRSWVSSGNTKLRAARKGASFPVAVAAVQAGDAAPTEDGLDLHVLETLVATVLSPAQQREEQARQTRRMIRAQCLAGSANTIKLP